jgi:hypothetical protein
MTEIRCKCGRRQTITETQEKVFTTYEGAKKIGWIEKKSGWVCPHCSSNRDVLVDAFSEKKVSR